MSKYTKPVMEIKLFEAKEAIFTGSTGEQNNITAPMIMNNAGFAGDMRVGAVQATRAVRLQSILEFK